jgi:hypothetical protein
MEATQTPTKPATLKDALEQIVKLESRCDSLELVTKELHARIEALSKPKGPTSTKEMTDEDARKVLFGDLKDKSHKEAASTLGLSYGQIYSCRLEFTFKHIHKEMRERGIKNAFVK